jgi:hypothetical protein
MNSKYINLKTIVCLLLILAGILLYISWGVRYGVWYDIGIYSITIVLVLAGLFGFILTTYFAEDTETE